MSHVEFSVSFKGEHVFTTKVSTAPKFRGATPEEVNVMLRARFPESEGFKVLAIETKTVSNLFKANGLTEEQIRFANASPESFLFGGKLAKSA